MYSYEERIKAVQLLLQYDMSYATVVRELGYPSIVAAITVGQIGLNERIKQDSPVPCQRKAVHRIMPLVRASLEELKTKCSTDTIGRI